MSNQEDKFDFSDFEDLGSKIQKTIDTATVEVLKQAGNVKEEALKQVDKAKEEASRQMDKARESATRQFDKAKEGAARQFDRFYGGQNEQAYVDVGHGRRVISGKLRKNPGLYSGPAEIAIGVAGLAGFGSYDPCRCDGDESGDCFGSDFCSICGNKCGTVWKRYL